MATCNNAAKDTDAGYFYKETTFLFTYLFIYFFLFPQYIIFFLLYSMVTQWDPLTLHTILMLMNFQRLYI